MLRHDSQVTRLGLPKISDLNVLSFFNSSTRYFKEFKDNLTERDAKLNIAIEEIKNAIKRAEKDSLDLAICQYRLASLLIHKKSAEESKEAYVLLEQSITIVEQQLKQMPDNETLQIELQKQWALKTKCCMDIKNGEKFEECLNKFSESLALKSNPDYELDYYRYKFQLHFSKNELELAEECYKRSLKFQNYDHAPDFKNLALIRIARGLKNSNTQEPKKYFENLINDKNFWLSFDIYKNYAQDNPSYSNKKKFKKELVWLFRVYLLFKTPENAQFSVMKIADKVFLAQKWRVETRDAIKKEREIFEKGEKLYFVTKLFEIDPPSFSKKDLIGNLKREGDAAKLLNYK